MRPFLQVAAATAVILFGIPYAAAAANPIENCNGATELEAIVSACRQVIESSSTSTTDLLKARLRRADAYSKIGDYDYAGKDFDAALAIAPNNVDALYARGQFLVERKELDKAINDFTAAIALSPSDAKLYISRGLAFFRNRKFDDAISDHTVAIKLLPDDTIPLNARSCALIVTGKYDAAIADAEQAIRLQPKQAFGYINRGTANFEMGNRDLASRDYDKAVELESDNPVSHAARFEYYVTKYDDDKAMPESEKIFNRPGNHDLLSRSYGIACTSS